MGACRLYKCDVILWYGLWLSVLCERMIARSCNSMQIPDLIFSSAGSFWNRIARRLMRNICLEGSRSDFGLQNDAR